MPTPALSADAARMRTATLARRRRDAVAALRLAEQICATRRAELANGLGPGEARAAAWDAAAELVAVAEVLRRSARPSREERRRLAVLWIGRGSLSRRQVADRLGVSERTVHRYLGHP